MSNTDETPTKKSFGSRLFSALLEPTEEEPVPATPVAAVKPATTIPSYTSAGPSAAVTPNLQVLADVQARVEEAAAPALSALRGGVKTLTEFIPDPNARFKAALQMVVKQGHSETQVSVDIKESLAAIEGYEKDASDAYNKAFDSAVLGKRSEALALKAEALRLRKEADEADAKALVCSNEAQEREETLRGRHDSTAAALVIVRSEIEAYQNQFEAAKSGKGV